MAAALCCLLASGAASAQVAGMTTRFSGFGSLIGAFTNSDETQFRNSPIPSSGVDKSLNIGNDSKIGLQGTLGFVHDVSVTAQLLIKRDADQDFKPGVEWLFAQYSGVPGLDLRLGRMTLPAFLVSESREVGYALTPLRVSPTVYGLLPFTSLDGVQANYRHSIGSAVVSVQASNGKASLRSSGSGAPSELVVNDIGGLNGTVEWGSWTARVGQVRSHWSSAGKSGVKDTFNGYGLQYDDGTAVVVGESIRRTTMPSAFSGDAWYVMAGWRFGTWTPYAMTGRYTAKSVFGPPGTKLPPPSEAQSLGLRWDFATSVAMKADFSRFDANHPTNFTVKLPPGRRVSVASIGLDFVF